MSAGDYTDDQLVEAVRLCGGWAPLSAVRARLETTAGLDAGVGPRAKAATWPVALPDHPGSQWRTLWPVNTRGSAHRDFRTALDAGALVEVHGAFNHGYLPAGKVDEYNAARARAKAARQAINDRQRGARDRLKQLAAVPPPPARTERGTTALVHCVELTLEEAEALVQLLDRTRADG